MEISTLLWIIVASIAIAVFLSAKFKINIGIIGFVAAYFIGTFLLGMSTKTIASFFPASLFLQMVLIPAFFHFSIQNKALPALSQKILYAFRNRPGAIPFVFLLVGTVLGLGGVLGPIASVVLTVMCFGIGLEMGLSPWLLIVTCAYGSNLGGWTPYTGSGLISARITEEWLPGLGERVAWSICLSWAVFTLLIFLAIWVLTKGYRIKATQMEKPADLTKEQKISTTMIILYMVCLIVPAVLSRFFPQVALISKVASWAQPEILAVIGILIQLLMKMGKSDDLVKNGMAWSTGLMIAGLSTLMNIATNQGVTDYLGNVLSDNIAPFWMPLVLCLLAGLLSCFAGANTTVFPLLVAIAVPYAQASGSNPLPLLTAIMMGANATLISPFSTGGALIIATVPNEEVRDGLFYKNLTMAGVGLVVACLLCTFFIPLIT